MPWRQPNQTPFRLTSMVRSQTASSVDWASPSSASMIPALLNSTSSRPKASSASPIAAATEASTATSAVSPTAVPPAPVISATTSAVPSPSRSTTATEAPSAANSRAVWRPMPAAAPVMKVALPVSRPVVVSIRRASHTGVDV